MTRGMRLLIVFCVFIGVIMLMMDCAKKTMRKKKTEGGQGESHGLIMPMPESGGPLSFPASHGGG